mgnify:CR=1 FL=1
MILSKDKNDNILELLKILVDKHHLINKISLDLDDQFNDIFTSEDEKWIREANENPNWTEAINENLISKTEEDEKEKTIGILSTFANNDIKNKKICDFNVKTSLKDLALSYGALTAINFNSIKEIKDNSPYDHIFMYDFLDHVEDPVSYLIIARECLKKEGKIHIRFHPWCSRHGGHAFRKLNKAWIHLFLSEKVLFSLNNNKLCPQKVIHPINTYDSWIREAKLTKLNKEIIITKQTDSFLTEPHIFKKLIESYKNSTNIDFRNGNKLPEYQLSMQFVDMQVTK